MNVDPAAIAEALREMYPGEWKWPYEVEAVALADRLSEIDSQQCPERCLGVKGHSGPHQTSDYVPPKS